MNCLGFIYLLLLIIFLHSTLGNNCSFDVNMTPKITAIGRPIGQITVSWNSVNSSGQLVSYQVHYNRTSNINHCMYPLSDALYTAKKCNQTSTRAGIHHQCDLTKEYKMLKMDMRRESLCVLISITSTSTNETCYSFFKEYISYIDYSICPVPEDLKVYSPEPKKLAVNWNVSPKLVGSEVLNEMTFIIHYEAVGNSTRCKALKETKPLKALDHNFYHQNNTYIVKNLESCCQYMVTICCDFFGTECHPGYVSHPFYVTTAEQEPTRAPQVEWYNIQNGNLLVKWKIPSSDVCTEKSKEFEIQYGEQQDSNCSTINNGSAIKKYITTRSSDRVANITGILPSVRSYCFRIRICNDPGCGPWSKVYTAEDYTLPLAKKRTSNSGLHLTSTETAAIIVAVLAMVILVVAVSCFIIKMRNRPDAHRTLEGEVGDLEQESDLLNSSQSTTEMESLNDYATA